MSKRHRRAGRATELPGKVKVVTPATKQLSDAAKLAVASDIKPLMQARAIIDGALSKATQRIAALDNVKPDAGWKLNLSREEWVKG